MATDLPLPTTQYIPLLVSEGACFCLPAGTLTVPIPLIDVRINNDRMIVWATIQTPFGADKALFGIIRYAKQERLPVGSEFYDADGRQLCAIIDVRAFGFPQHIEEKLIKKARLHARRIREDIVHRTIWDEHFAMGILSCTQNGQ